MQRASGQQLFSRYVDNGEVENSEASSFGALPVNLANLLVRAGRAFGPRPAISVGDQVRSTYGSLSERVGIMAGNLLRDFSLESGDRIALVMKNCEQYIEVLFACWHAGLTAVPVNAKLAPKELEYVLRHSGARICFVTDDWANAVDGLRPSIASLKAVIPVGSQAYSSLLQGTPMEVVARAPTDTAWLFYTSGTTGRPKGAMLSHRALLTMTSGYFIDVDSITSSDSILHVAPMSHGSGMYILPHVAAAANQIVPESGGFDPEEVFELIKAYKGVSFFAAPTIVRRLVNSSAAATADTRNLKTIVYGGAPMYLEDCKQAISCFGGKLAQIFGQGESPMTITVLSKAAHSDLTNPRYEQRLSSVGMPKQLSKSVLRTTPTRRCRSAKSAKYWFVVTVS